MGSFVLSIIIAVGITSIFTFLQNKNYQKTKQYIEEYSRIFDKLEDYATDKLDGTEAVKLKEVGTSESELNGLIKEINYYVFKTKGTTDFAIIQNKVERLLSMKYDQATSRIAFPTYLGLMGTFAGVFMGILGFVLGISTSASISDDAITNLLVGVLISMATSLLGLVLTTCNSARSSEAKRKTEEDKNEFYSFIQTELMPTLDVSLVTAVTKLHLTVDKFEPAFNSVIEKFNDTFIKCTKAFGHDFQSQVKVVSKAVEVMGSNMDKINQNITIQKQLLETLKSDELVKGMDKYVEAANHFVGITQSLNKFEEARRMMLAATQEAISLQNQYTESLNIPREIAIRINQILDRVKDFEKGVNEVGNMLNKREILGNDIVEAIQNQIQGISRKNKIADNFLSLADYKLEELYTAQTAVIDNMNKRYKDAIEGHIEGFEKMLMQQTKELEIRHKQFMQALEERFKIEDIRKEFTNLKKLDTLEYIDNKLGILNQCKITPEILKSEIKMIQQDLQNCKLEVLSPDIKEVKSQLEDLKTELIELNKKDKESDKRTGGFSSWFSRNEN